MNKKFLILTGISISASFFAQDVSTIRNTTEIYDNNSLTGTARYSAMAGSMGALGGDISSLNNNPAGLGVFITSDASASLSINSTKTTASLNGSSKNNNIDKTALGQIGGILSFQTENDNPWKFVNVGINFINEKIDNKIQSPGNHNIKNEYLDNQGNVTDYLLYSGHLHERIGSRSKLNIGIGANYDNKIYIGAGINLSSTDIEQYDEALLSSQNNAGENAYFKKQNTPYREESSGFSISAGIIGKINNKLRLGLSLESPTWYGVDREYVYYVDSSTNIYSPIISSYTAVEDRNLRTPGKLTLSGAFIPNKNFSFNVDYKRDLGKPHFSGGATEEQLNDFYNDTYKAQNEVRLGGEYRYNNFRVRGGYAFATSPFKDYSYSNSNYGIINNDGSISTNGKLSNYIVGKSQVISGGIGYNFKTFYVDATYQHITYTYTNPFIDGLYVYSSSSNNGYYIDSNTSIVSNAKTKKGNFILTLGWKF